MRTAPPEKDEYDLHVTDFVVGVLKHTGGELDPTSAVGLAVSLLGKHFTHIRFCQCMRLAFPQIPLSALKEASYVAASLAAGKPPGADVSPMLEEWLPAPPATGG